MTRKAFTLGSLVAVLLLTGYVGKGRIVEAVIGTLGKLIVETDGFEKGLEENLDEIVHGRE